MYVYLPTVDPGTARVLKCTFMWTFFTKYVPQYCLIYRWMNLQMQSPVYGGLAGLSTLKMVPLTPALLKGQLYIVYLYPHTHTHTYTFVDIS